MSNLLPDNKPTRSDRVNEIDLLRFVAALLVLVFHYAFRGAAADNMSVMNYPWLAPVARYGYLGVQLFFLISGFVILMTAASGSVRSFAVSRIVRLYPAFWASCTVTYLVCILFGGPIYEATFKQYMLNMTMLGDYLRVPAIDGVYWSLSLEIRFYALVAMLMLIKQIHRAEAWLWAWLISTAILEFVYPVGKLRFLLITNASAFFIGGATMFLIWSKGLTRARVALTSGSLAVGLIQTLQGREGFESHYHTSLNPLVMGALILIFYGVMMLVTLRKTGALAPIRWTIAGAMTYPLYLLHQNIGFIIFNHAYPHLNIHLIFWGTIALMLLSAYGIHVLIEKKYTPPFKRALNNTIDTFSQLGRARG